MSTPVIILNSSPATWPALPMPFDGHVDLARIGLGVGDELGNRLDRNRWIDHHDEGSAVDTRDRHDVADEIEAKIVVESRIERVGRCNLQERVAIGKRPDYRFSGEICAGTRSVLDDELLPESLRQPFTHQPRNDVRPTTSGITDDHAYWPRRISLRPSEARHGRERGSARCQMQESAREVSWRAP